MEKKQTKVGLVDDHTLFRKGLAELVGSFPGFTVAFELGNGRELQEYLNINNLPDVILLDINMPVLDGFETASWLKNTFPDVKVVGLSMNDTEDAIIQFLKSGANGYLLKDADPDELEFALKSVMTKGFYHTGIVANVLVAQLNKKHSDTVPLLELNERETEFIKLACTELTYKEIADKMLITPRTVDGYREALFEKLNVKSRVGLAMYAIKAKIVQVQ